MSSVACASSGTVRFEATTGRGVSPSERSSHLIHRRGSLVLEEGGQGVLFHRKEQGLRTNLVRRRCNTA